MAEQWACGKRSLVSRREVYKVGSCLQAKAAGANTDTGRETNSDNIRQDALKQDILP